MMLPDEAADSLISAGVTVRRGKLGSVLLVDFRSAPPPQLEQLQGWLQAAGHFQKCRELYLTNLAVADEGIEYLVQHLPVVQVLDLEGTAVSDRVLEIVGSLAKLKMLVLTRTRVSDEAIRVARKRMIQTRIVKLGSV